MIRPTLTLAAKTESAAPKPKARKAAKSKIELSAEPQSEASAPETSVLGFLSRTSKLSRNEQACVAVKFLAELGLPLFQHMARTGVILPMAFGIRDVVLVRTDPALHSTVRKALAAIAYSFDYQHAVLIEGARRRTVDNADAGAIAFDHRLFARSLLIGERRMIAADLGL